MGRLIIDGNSVYELDEACMKEREKEKREERMKKGMDQYIKSQSLKKQRKIL